MTALNVTAVVKIQSLEQDGNVQNAIILIYVPNVIMETSMT